jgi:hypothetical protein
MDIPPLGVEPPVPIQPIGDTKRFASPEVPAYPATPEEQAWTLMAQAILSRAPKLFSFSKMVQRFHAVPTQPLAKRFKIGGEGDQPVTAAIVRQVAAGMGERSERLVSQFTKVLAQVAKAPSETMPGQGRCSAIAQKLNPGEGLERFPNVFAKQVPEKARTEEAPQVPQQRPEGEKEKVVTKKESERPEEVRPLEKEEREKILEREKVIERRETKETTALKYETSSTVAAAPVIPQRIPPEVFLGLGNLLTVAQRMATSPEFRAAKATLIVIGQRQKAFVQHVLKAFGPLHKQIYIWSLEEESFLGSAWSFLQRIKMPQATLLDLNLGRKSGGWARVKWTLRTLSTLHGGKLGELALEDIDLFPHWDASAADMGRWIAFLEEHGIYFFAPLDFDFSLLRALPEYYLAEKSVTETVTPSWKAVMDVPPHLMGYTPEDCEFIPSYYELFVQENPLLAHQEVWRKAGVSILIQRLPDAINHALKRLAYYCGAGG